LISFVVLCKHLRDPPGTNFAIIQLLQHCFQCITAYIKPCSQFPGHYPPIRREELIKGLFIVRSGSWAGTPRAWLVVHFTFAAASLCWHPLYHFHTPSMDVNGCNLLGSEKFSNKSLFRTHFYVRCHFGWLLSCRYE
jgi:hypothetical protein